MISGVIQKTEIHFSGGAAVKQIILSIAMLAIALALVIGVIVPFCEHGAEQGDKASEQGRLVLTRLGNILE